jgi:hypothetical protein
MAWLRRFCLEHIEDVLGELHISLLRVLLLVLREALGQELVQELVLVMLMLLAQALGLVKLRLLHLHTPGHKTNNHM